MTVCLVAEQASGYAGEASKPCGHGFEAFFTLAEAAAVQGLPPADLYLVPAATYLECGRDKPIPAFAYGPAEFCADCLDAGALDYLREPWDSSELSARIRRRLYITRRLSGVCYDLLTGDLYAGARRLRLKPHEQAILRCLALAPDGIATRKALSLSIWGEDRRDSRALDVHVSDLRRTLESLSPGWAPRIRALRGQGYRLEIAIDRVMPPS